MAGIIFPYSSAMRVVGGLVLTSVIVNALIVMGTNWGSQWYFDWSPIFLYFGLTLVVSSLWHDPKLVLVFCGVLSVLWWVFIVLGWSWPW